MTMPDIQTPMVRRRSHRRGGVAVMAMLYLSLFAMLAVAFTGMSNSTVQVSANQRHIQRAYLATEVGLTVAHDFLLTVDGLPKTKESELSSSDQEAVWTEIQQQVINRFSGTSNMVNLHSGTMQSVNVLTDELQVPQISTIAPYGIWLDDEPSSARFAFTLTRSDDNGDMVIDLTVTGMDGPANGVVRRQAGFAFRVEKNTELLKYGIASRNRIMISRNVLIDGDIFSMFDQVSYGPPIHLRSNFLAHLSTANVNALESLIDQYDMDTPGDGIDNDGDGMIDEGPAGDRRLSEEEYIDTSGTPEEQQVQMDEFANMDLNGDQFIDEIDYLLAQYDTNDDSQLGSSEFAVDNDLFTLYDLDVSGVLEQSELIAKVRPFNGQKGMLLVRSDDTVQTDPLWSGYDDYIDGTNGGAGTAEDLVDFTREDFDTTSYMTATGMTSIDSQQSPTGQVHAEPMPYGSPHPQDYFDRPVYENISFSNTVIPKGTNALFINCTFDGVTFVESEPDNTDYYWNYGGAQKSDGSARYPTLVTYLNGAPVNPKDHSNNLRFEDCTFNGPIISDNPQAYTHRRNKLVFNGNTRFFNTYLPETTLLTPHYSIDMGSFTDPSAQSKMTGAIVAGIFDVRGTAEIEGSILTTFYPEWGGPPVYNGNPANFNTTIGFFDDGEGTEPEEGWGRIHIHITDQYSLPYGINTEAVIIPVDDSYWEGSTAVGYY